VERGVTIWITGLPAAGKTTLAEAVADVLATSTARPIVLDGDAMRAGLNSDLGYSEADRAEVTRRLGEVALLITGSGHDAVVASISPSAAARASVRKRHEENAVTFCEVYLDVPVEECERRDPKGLYAAARRGEVQQMTGVSSPYEAPTAAEVVVKVGVSPGEAADEIRRRVRL
jgi:bifunctional enzyme CysN/CysC